MTRASSRILREATASGEHTFTCGEARDALLGAPALDKALHEPTKVFSQDSHCYTISARNRQIPHEG